MTGSANATGSSGGGDSDATWNSLDKTASITLSNGNLTAFANTTTFEGVRATANALNTATGGKFYWEMNVDALTANTDIYVGVRSSSTAMTSGVDILSTANHAAWRGNAFYFVNGWTAGSAPTTIAAGNRLMFALDIDNRRLWVGKNGTWNNSGNPASGTNPSFSNMPLAVNSAPFIHTDNVTGSVQVTLVPSSGDFLHTIPSGFTLL